MKCPRCGYEPPDNEVQAEEVAWYRLHGRYSERIRLDGSGRPYVIGDWSWNQHYPHAREEVEDRMHREGVYRL